MKLRLLLLLAILVASIRPTYGADQEAMSILQNLVSKWQIAYNKGDAEQIANLYAPDGIFSSGILGVLKGRADIEKAIANELKTRRTISGNVVEAYRNGNVVWGVGDFMFPQGPSGHFGITAVNAAGSWQIAMEVSNVPPPKKR